MSFEGPLLIIHGDIDQFASLAQIKDFVQAFLNQRKKDSWTQVLQLEGCDHFFQGEPQSVADAVCRWISRAPFLSRTSA